ncbi:hypothetical protein L1887_57205 [Cichorium endivia]|nr:hypothetical protein L1887_57205 [Cichorium endivia]
MRSRRKSTFTSSRPPVSGPARRRESLAAAAGVPVPQPLPPVPSLVATTPGRSRPATVARVASNSPSLKTPTATARIAKPRPSLTGATPRASAAPSVAGSIPRPRASLTGRMSLGPAQEEEAKTPAPRAGQIRSASLVTPSARAAARSVQAEATPLGGHAEERIAAARAGCHWRRNARSYGLQGKDAGSAREYEPHRHGSSCCCGEVVTSDHAEERSACSCRGFESANVGESRSPGGANCQRCGRGRAAHSSCLVEGG